LAIEKHWAASVYVFGRVEGAWKIALLRHKKFGLWMVPGGHVDFGENPAEAAVREVREETGLAIELRLLRAPWHEGPCHEVRPIPLPEAIVEEDIPLHGETEAHVHLDCLYFAVAEETEFRVGPGESAHIGWFGAEQLSSLEMFESTRAKALNIFGRLDRKSSLTIPGGRE
jgi:8-oxo-dGTP pyrophosphatase MutT (NUDIX family)